jgi:hypothetical protein
MKSLFLALLTLLTLGYVQTISAQTGSLAGTITDSRTNETIIGANVIISGTITGSSTNLDGYYEIKNLTPGNYNVVVSFISYKTDTITNVKIKGGEVTKLN